MRLFFNRIPAIAQGLAKGPSGGRGRTMGDPSERTLGVGGLDKDFIKAAGAVLIGVLVVIYSFRVITDPKSDADTRTQAWTALGVVTGYFLG